MKIKKLFFAAAAAMTLTACSNDDDVQNVLPVSQFPEDGVMRFTTNLVDPTAAATRASITSSDVNKDGQQFQVKIVNNASDVYSYFANVVYDGYQWNPQTRMLWQNKTTPITVTAAYMQGKTFTNSEFENGADLTVAADQSTEAKLKQQDLLTMPTKTIANPSSETVLLQGGKLVINFYHALAKLDVTLELKDEFYLIGQNNPTDITEFAIKGTNAGYNFKAMTANSTNTSGVVTPAETPVAADILANQCEFTAATAENKHSTAKYESIVVPQAIAAGALTVSFKIGDRSFSWTNTSAFTLEQGKHYTLPLTVGNNAVSMASGALSVGSWGNGTGDALGTE